MDDDAPVVDEHQLAARALAWLFAAGGALALLWVLLPHDARANDDAFIAVVIGFSALSGLTWLAQGRLRMRELDLLVGLTTVLVSAAIYYSGAPTSAFALLYSWAVLHAFHYLPVRHAVGQLLFAVVSYALVTLALSSDGDVLSRLAARWLLVVGDAAGGGVLPAAPAPPARARRGQPARVRRRERHPAPGLPGPRAGGGAAADLRPRRRGGRVAARRAVRVRRPGHRRRAAPARLRPGDAAGRPPARPARRPDADGPGRPQRPSRALRRPARRRPRRPPAGRRRAGQRRRRARPGRRAHAGACSGRSRTSPAPCGRAPRPGSRPSPSSSGWPCRTPTPAASSRSRPRATPSPGLANHRAFHERLRTEVGRARRYERPLVAGAARPRPLQAAQRHPGPPAGRPRPRGDRQGARAARPYHRAPGPGGRRGARDDLPGDPGDRGVHRRRADPRPPSRRSTSATSAPSRCRPASAT